MQIGLIGTGFIGSGIARIIKNTPDMEISRVLTRRPVQQVHQINPDLLTRDIEELITASDIIVECSGDAIYATEVLEKVAQAGLPVVTINAEFQVTTGSYFAQRMYLTEADGDQPGCLARLNQEICQMGFKPLAYVNIKGFLNRNPSKKDMIYWSEKQNLRFEQTMSFTDGSKLQIEQVLVANGLGAELVCDGMTGFSLTQLADTDYLAHHALALGYPVSDYVLCPGSPPGIFILADSEEMRLMREYLPFAKLLTSQGSAYLFLRHYHLCYLEISRILTDIIRGEPPLLNNGIAPRYGVAAIAKQRILPNHKINRALGSLEFRGEAVHLAHHPHHVPICLLAGAIVKRELEPGQILQFKDVDLPPSRALEIYLKLQQHNKV